MADINSQIEQRIQSFVTELTALVRSAALEAVSGALQGNGAHRAPRAAAPTRAAAPAPAHAAPAAKRAGGKRIRRTAAQIDATVGKVLAYIKSNPGSRSENIREALKLERPLMRDALDRLGTEKKIKMKGQKRAATYTAA